MAFSNVAVGHAVSYKTPAGDVVKALVTAAPAGGATSANLVYVSNATGGAEQDDHGRRYLRVLAIPFDQSLSAVNTYSNDPLEI
jgi:hypothetical protein